MSQDQKETGIAVLTQSDIPTMLETVKNQIKQLSSKSDAVSKTSNSLTGFGTIDNIATVEDLIKAHASVFERGRAYDKAAAAIVPSGIKVPPFILDGHNEKDWLDHISSRVGEVANEKKLTKLREYAVILESNLSAEFKLANDLAKIKADMEEGY